MKDSENENPDSKHSGMREKLMEHMFIGELLRTLWIEGIYDVEIARSEVDNLGADLIISQGKITRHVQLKSSATTGKTSDQKLNLLLGGKPSGCVIWIVFEKDSMKIKHFLWFGGEPGEQLPDISYLKEGKHSKGNKDGEKLIRPMIRTINKGAFTKVETMEGVITKLIGK